MRSSEIRVLIIVCCVALAHSLLWIFVQPPWQHYDEPGHFEYASLFAKQGQVPNTTDVDLGLRRELYASMGAHGLLGDQRFSLAKEVIPPIGVSQLNDVPVYYLLQSVPAMLFANSDITVRLYSMRLLSAVLLLVVTVCAYFIASEIGGTKSHLRWILPLCVSFTPGYADALTGVNNDVGAAAIGSVGLCLIVRTLSRGATTARLSGLVITALIGLFVKATTAVVLVLFLVLLIVLGIRASRLIRTVTVLAVAALGFASSGYFDDLGLADWVPLESGGSQQLARRDAPDGDFVFAQRLDQAGGEITQLVSHDSRHDTKITIGSWIWIDGAKSVSVAGPRLSDIGTGVALFEDFVVSETPAFYVVTGTIPAAWSRIRFSIRPQGFQPRLKHDPRVNVFFDNVILVEGHFTADQLRDAQHPAWRENWIYNASAEAGSRWLNDRFESYRMRLQFSPREAFALLGSPKMTSVLVTRVLRHVIESFWGRFAWGQISLPERLHTALLIASMLSVGVTALSAFRWRMQQGVLWSVLILGSLISSAMIVFRGIDGLWNAGSWLPSVRYSSPVIIGHWALLLAGWYQICEDRGPKWTARLGTVVVLCLVSLSAYSLLTVWRAQQAMLQLVYDTNQYERYIQTHKLGSACSENDEKACDDAWLLWRSLGGDHSDLLRHARVTLESRELDLARGYLSIYSRFVGANQANDCDRARESIVSSSVGREINDQVSFEINSVTSTRIDGGQFVDISDGHACGRLLADLDPQNSTAGTLWWNGSASVPVRAISTDRYRLEFWFVDSPPSPIRGAVGVNGARLERIELVEGNGLSRLIVVEAKLNKGLNTIDFYFDNDADVYGADRNLTLRWVDITTLARTQ